MDQAAFQLHLNNQTYDKLYQDIEIICLVGYSESHKTWDNIKDIIDWKDKTVIDVAGFHGYFSFKIEQAGAAQVICMDRSPEILQTTQYITKLNNSKIILKQWESKELIPQGDVILFLNCLHHFPDQELTLQNAKCSYGIFEVNNKQVPLIEKYFEIIKTQASHRQNRIIVLSKKKLSPEEELIFNQGERLIPYLTHNNAEITRHQNSYRFFAQIIKQASNNEAITILDYGCGVGHGSKLLADLLPNSKIYGYDINETVLQYAAKYYNSDRITYGKCAPTCDYIVSRGVFEHIASGLELLKELYYTKMLIFDVPYNEPKYNKYHLLTEITENTFNYFKNIEFYYEDINGNISKDKIKKPNMLMGVIRK